MSVTTERTGESISISRQAIIASSGRPGPGARAKAIDMDYWWRGRAHHSPRRALGASRRRSSPWGASTQGSPRPARAAAEPATRRPFYQRY
jgi:hypothetical protein